jgi:hypothetical protein
MHFSRRRTSAVAWFRAADGARCGCSFKAEIKKGHHVYDHFTGYENSPVTRRIEPNPERAPIIAEQGTSFVCDFVVRDAVFSGTTRT